MVDKYLKPSVKRGATYDAVAVIVLGILSAIPVLGCLLTPVTCVVGMLLPLGIGWLVAQWNRTMPASMTPLSMSSTSPYATPAIDGAVAAGVGHLVGGLVSLILGLLLSGLWTSIGLAGDPGTAGDVATGLAIGAAGGVVGWIFGAVVAAIAGAIGGILYVWRSQSQSPAM